MKTLVNIVFILFLSLAFINPKAKAAPVRVASLSFAWTDPVSMAVFQRDEYTWLVFNRRKAVDIAHIEKSLKIFNPKILAIPHSKATVIRIKLKQDINPHVRKEGLLWIVDFVEGKAEYKIQELQTQIRKDGLDRPYIFIENDSFAEPISIIDPDIGDNIIVDPALSSSVGILREFSFVDFNILKSVQGFAIVPKNDDVIVIRSNDGASIKSLDSGLSVSENLDELQRLSILNQQDDLGNVFDLEVPQALLDQKYLNAKKFLENDIKKATGKLKLKAEFQLAKYYVAKAMGVEALSLLNKMIKENGFTEAQKHQVYGLRGAANFLSGRYQEALSDLSYNDLQNNPSASFWRRLVEASINPYTYDQTFLDYAPVIKEYPKDIQIKIAAIAAQTSINARDDLGAQNFIDIIKLSVNDTPSLMPILLYLSAQNMALQGYPKDALDRYQEIIDHPSQKYSAYARLAAAILQYEIKAKKVDETIKELEKIKLSWSETEFKIKILHTLARLYIAKHDYNNAIQVMIEEHELVAANQKATVRKKIIEQFEALYIDNQADETPALKALSLYNEHLQIIKESTRFVDIAVSVADRFFAVDLVDNSKKILQDLLANHTITNEQKYKIGTRLALIYLYQNLNNDALDVLEKTNIPNPQINLENYRDVIKARVYKEMGLYDQALDILKGNYSRLATLLKSDIYWLNEDYENLSLELKYLIDEPQAGKPMSDEQVQYVLDWSMALKKAQKDIVLARVRAKFLPWFEDSKYSSTFDILTSQFDRDKVDINEISNRIENIKIFSDFNKQISENLNNIAKSENQKW